MTDLERGPSSEQSPTMRVEQPLLNNSPQSYYTGDKLEPCPFCGPGNSIVECYQDPYGAWTVGCGACGAHSGKRPKSDPDGRTKVITHWNRRPAATIISELQSERDALKHDIERHLGIIAELEGRISDLEVDLGNAKHSNNLIDEEMGEWKSCALAAESSLSRIKSETVEACAKVAENYRPFGKMQHHGTRRGIASAIRSLSTDDSEKTAESKHSPSTQNTRTE